MPTQYQFYNINLCKESELEIQVLEARNRILGAEHPETIHAMGNLAETYYALDKHTEAEKLQIQVLAARNRIFGEEHPHTLEAITNLGTTYYSLGE